MHLRVLPLSLTAILCLSSLTQAAEASHLPYEGRWIGMAKTEAETTRVVLDITLQERELRAVMTLLDVGVSGWPSKRINRLTKGIEVVFPSDSGDQTMRFSLEATEKGEPVLLGNWSEARFDEAANITLKRAVNRKTISERAVEVRGPDGKLSAAVIQPRGQGPYPGVVFLHGSGPQPKDTSRFAALALAEKGIASIIFDKRGVGQSEGTLAGASFDDLADDGAAVAKYFSSLPEVSSVGFFGHSQGGWIGPLAGTKWKETAFVITSAGPAVAPSREAHWDFIRKLHFRGDDSREIETARQIIEYWHDGIRTSDWGKLDVAVRAARAKPWFEPAGFGFFSQRPDETFARNYSAYMDYKPVPTLRQLDAPLLAILAPDDESIDTHETEEILRELIQAGNDIRIKLYPGYDHSLRRLGPEKQVLRWPEHPQDYYSVQADFIREVILSGDRP